MPHPIPKNCNPFWKIAWTLLVSMLLLACAPVVETMTEATPAPTAAPTAAPTPVPTPVPTPTPKVETLEPACEAAPDPIEVPPYYRLVSEPSAVPLYAFTNENGVVEYRTTGVVRTLTDGAVTEEAWSLFPADETGALAGTNPIDRNEEQPGVCNPLEADALRIKKRYVPTGKTGHFCDSAAEEPAYILYGSFYGFDPAFYPANEDGKMLPGGLPIDADAVVVSPYAPQKDPKKNGERHLTVFIGSESVVAFLAVDGDWEVEHVFICSTGDKGRYTPRGEFSITNQYEYKAMSRLNGVMVYAQYSSRFYGHYLFHTIPSAGQHKNYLPNGKQQLLVAEYEKLGTDVSHGCVRMLVGDCYWIYRNCPIGTGVTVTDDVGPTPPEKPALIYEEPYMDGNHQYGWDPTDPDPHNPYLQLPEYANALLVPTLKPNTSNTARPTHFVQASPTPTLAPTDTPTAEPTTTPALSPEIEPTSPSPAEVPTEADHT